MKWVLTLHFFLILAGCVSSSLNYESPVANETSTSKTVSKSYKIIWEQLIEGLAHKNFIIESVNKDSGLIVASKKLNPPSSYADCGTFTGHFKNARGHQNYNFSGSDSANYAVKDGQVVVGINKTTTLSSRSNIYVKKMDGVKSAVSVNTQFHLKLDMNSRANLYGQGPVNGQTTMNVEWTSHEIGQIDQGGRTKCVSTYAIENAILELVN